MTWFLVALGGAIGAPLRYLTDRAVQARHDGVFPWGTLAVNAAGSAVLGLVTGALAHGAASSRTALFAGTGFCGALTTYSTFSWETLVLAETGARGLALVNVAVSVTAAVGAAFGGAAAAAALWG